MHESGRRVPRDYSLVSYDNSAADALFEPTLTSIEQNVGELSHHAVGLMTRRLDNPSSDPIERVLKPHLVIKESVAPLR